MLPHKAFLSCHSNHINNSVTVSSPSSSESVKQRTNVFYLHPERSCVPNSPLWFSSTPLDDTTMETMLTRILTVREMHLRPEEGGEGDKMEDKEYSPPALEGDDDSDSD